MSPTTLDLVATHTRQIAFHASRRQARLPGCADLADLVQVGWEALLRSQARYQTAPATLLTYADQRIRGAMDDELRRLDPRTRYAQDQGVPPPVLLPLWTAFEVVAPTPTPEPFLVALVATLPARQQQVLRLCYVEGWREHEIGALLGCTQSRVSQIRTEALARLRTLMEDKGGSGEWPVGSRGDTPPTPPPTGHSLPPTSLPSEESP